VAIINKRLIWELVYARRDEFRFAARKARRC